MSPETQLALATVEAIARGTTLVIGFGPDLADALPSATVFQHDLRAFRACAGHPGARFGAWLDDAGPYESVVVALPKATERLRMILAMARTVMAPGARITVIGRNDAGIRSAGARIREAIGEPEVLDYRFHCRALTARRAVEGPLVRLEDWASEFPFEDLTVCSYPGVFAHGRVDEGTLRLLRALHVPVGARALDVGCGGGVIGAWLGRRGVTVDCVDVDALAVAAAERTLERNGIAGARVFASDLYSDAPGPYTHIVTNAPFHSGVRTTSEVARRLIQEAPEHLARGGELWLVANRFLDYLPTIAEVFGSVDVAFEDPKFRVYRARRR